MGGVSVFFLAVYSNADEVGSWGRWWFEVDVFGGYADSPPCRHDSLGFRVPTSCSASTADMIWSCSRADSRVLRRLRHI